MEINILTHDFEKQNIITIHRGGKFYDKVKCSQCGLEGIRYGLSDNIVVKQDKKCLKKAFKKVRIIGKYACITFGFDEFKIYDRVECPAEHVEKFKNDVWIYSEQRQEPVRLLPGEYELVNNEL